MYLDIISLRYPPLPLQNISKAFSNLYIGALFTLGPDLLIGN